MDGVVTLKSLRSTRVLAPMEMSKDDKESTVAAIHPDTLFPLSPFRLCLVIAISIAMALAASKVISTTSIFLKSNCSPNPRYLN